MRSVAAEVLLALALGTLLAACLCGLIEGLGRVGCL